MKKSILVFLCFVCFCLLAGCSFENSSEDLGVENDPSSATESVQNTIPSTEEATDQKEDVVTEAEQNRIPQNFTIWMTT